MLPTLKAGDFLVMDNFSAHKDSQALDLFKLVGITGRFLRAYSPDLNSIELMWNKVMTLLRKAEARTNEVPFLAIEHALSQVTQKDATKWFTHCCYSLNQNALASPTDFHDKAVTPKLNSTSG